MARYCRQTGKVRYRSHDDALQALITIVFDLDDHQRSTRTKCPCRSYVCRWCEAWHLTSLPYRGDADWIFGWWLTTTANRVVSNQQVSRIPTKLTDHRKAS